MEFRLSTKAGSAGDSTASTAAASLGKYMSTSRLQGGALGNLFDEATGQEATDGSIDYRCFFALNDTAAPFTGVAWIASQVAGGADVSIGLDPAGVTAENSASAQAAEIADELTAPAGVTFSVPTTEAVGLVIGTLAAGECAAIWVKRRVPAGAHARARDGATLVVGGAAYVLVPL